jgi:cation-transporting P-type ATPase E
MTDTLVAPAEGLTTDQARQRLLAGLGNHRPSGSDRSLGDIVRANVLTPFNFLLGALAVAVMATGSWRDAMFGLVLVANSLIGVTQEVRAKRALDRLAVLEAPRARVVRDGTVVEVDTDDVVLGDLMELRAGDQVVADGVLQSVRGLEVDESLLTGEADHVTKETGDEVLSGTFVAAGSGRCEVTGVGAASYASRMTEQARHYATTTSELMTGINRILKYVAVAVVVIGPVLFFSQRRSTDTWQEGVQGAVAGLVGIVPEGLVLLTSVAFFAAARTMARRRVLVRELSAVEGLARVDVICLDKTGTLTEGDIALDHVEELNPLATGIESALAALAGGEGNATQLAVRRAFPAATGWTETAAVPFASDRKWSAASFDGHGTWVLGAPEMVRPDACPQDPVLTRAGALAAAGKRTLLLAHTCAPLIGTQLPDGLEPMALVALHETLRADAAETVDFFAAQDVTVKVISGDNPRTVGAVATRAGVPGAGSPVDARHLPAGGEALADAVAGHAVFGRVVPEQKQAMVGALQSRGHVVAMTGDGVNDALALKDADIGVAMGSGAPITRAVAQLVLLDNQFAVMPKVVAEGRRVIANIERVAALFLTKNVSSLLLSLSVALAGWPYPFLPRHVTLVSSLAIGIPGFFLALGPNDRRFEGGFVRRVLTFAVPAGAVMAAAVMAAYGLARAQSEAPREARTAATMVFLMASLWVLVVQARPLQRWKVALVATMAGLSVLSFAVPVARNFFDLQVPSLPALGQFVLLGAAAAAAIEGVARLPRLGPALQSWRRRRRNQRFTLPSRS